MHNVIVSKLNNNDDSCVLVEWLVADAEVVGDQQMLALLETSKATFELFSEARGILHQVARTGDEIKFGDVVGYLFESEAERAAFLASKSGGPSSGASSLTITKGARELLEQHQITEAELATLGKKVITKADIESLIQAKSGQQAETIVLSRRQAAIAETVALSHRTIPKSFMVMKIYSDAATQMLSDFMANHDVMVGLPELIITITASLVERFPIFFGTLIDGNQLVPATQPGVGVTFDVGKGLFIPVVKNAGAKSLSEIADTLMDFRVKAFRNTFKEEDFSGGNITISLNTDEDVVFVMPIILPSQVAMLSLSAVQEELALTPEGAVTTRGFINMGLAYDHRVVNGFEAVEFLKAIKSRLESLEGEVA